MACGDSDQGTTAYSSNSGGNVSGDVFYSYTGDGTRKIVNVSLCESGFDTFVRVFTDCSMTQEVTNNNDFCGTQSFVSFVAEPTSTYYIMVEGYNTAVGDYVINLSCADAPPVLDNDNCSDVTPVTLTNGEPMTFTGSTEWATASPNEVTAFGFGTVWEAVTLTGECNNLTVDYCGTPVGNMNHGMVSMTLCPIDGWLSGVEEYDSCEDGNRTVRFYNLPAGTYYLPVMVDPESNTLGEYTMNVLSENCPPPPANDECENAIPLSCDDSDSGSTLFALDSNGDGSRDVFYTYTGNGEEQLVTVSLCGSSYDTVLRVFTDCTLTEEIAMNDDSCGYQSEVKFVADGPSQYIIMVDGAVGNAGDYEISISCEDLPLYDPCAPVRTGEFDNAAGLVESELGSYVTANDFNVLANTEFTVSKVTVDILTNGGQPTTFDVSFYDGNKGVQNQIGETINLLTPSSMQQTGMVQNGIFQYPVYTVVLTLPEPRTFQATENDQKFWVAISLDLDDAGQNVYWIASEYLYPDTLPTWQSADGGTTWQLFAPGAETEGVMSIEGECQELLGASDLNSFDFSYHPNPVKHVLNISSKKSIENVSVLIWQDKKY